MVDFLYNYWNYFRMNRNLKKIGAYKNLIPSEVNLETEGFSPEWTEECSRNIAIPSEARHSLQTSVLSQNSTFLRSLHVHYFPFITSLLPRNTKFYPTSKQCITKFDKIPQVNNISCAEDVLQNNVDEPNPLALPAHAIVRQIDVPVPLLLVFQQHSVYDKESSKPTFLWQLLNIEHRQRKVHWSTPQNWTIPRLIRN